MNVLGTSLSTTHDPNPRHHFLMSWPASTSFPLRCESRFHTLFNPWLISTNLPINCVYNIKPCEIFTFIYRWLCEGFFFWSIIFLSSSDFFSCSGKRGRMGNFRTRISQRDFERRGSTFVDMDIRELKVGRTCVYVCVKLKRRVHLYMGTFIISMCKNWLVVENLDEP